MQAIVWIAWSLTNISIEGKLKISHGGFFFCVHLTRSLKFEQEIKFKTHLFTEIWINVLIVLCAGFGSFSSRLKIKWYKNTIPTESITLVSVEVSEDDRHTSNARIIVTTFQEGFPQSVTSGWFVYVTWTAITNNQGFPVRQHSLVPITGVWQREWNQIIV